MEINDALKVFLWAMTPIGELRAAIPIGITLYKMNWVAVYFFAVLGNLFAVFLLLAFLGAVYQWSSRHIYPVRKPALSPSRNKYLIYWFRKQLSNGVYFFNRFFAWLFSKTKENHQHKISKYGHYLLPIFVAIPLPVTGGWTASLIAFVFGIPLKKAFPLIGAGILIAGLIVLFLTQTGVIIQRNFGWQALLGILLVLGIIYWLYKKKK